MTIRTIFPNAPLVAPAQNVDVDPPAAPAVNYSINMVWPRQKAANPRNPS